MSRASFVSLLLVLVACTSSSPEGDDETAGTENAINGTTPANAKTCFFDTSSGKPNPLGARTLVTLVKSEDGTIVRYETLPAPVFDLEEGTTATFAVRRDLLLHGLSLDAARKALRARDGKLWAQIWDEETAPLKFSEWEKTITCTRDTFEPEIGPIDTEMCGYDPSTEQGPNLLGMRTYVTLHQAGGNTEARYETFPANVGAGNPIATIEQIRSVTIAGVRMRDAMEKMRTEAGAPLVEALIGDPMSTADVGELFDTFTCQ
jgi:hypothetical protein